MVNNNNEEQRRSQTPYSFRENQLIIPGAYPLGKEQEELNPLFYLGFIELLSIVSDPEIASSISLDSIRKGAVIGVGLSWLNKAISEEQKAQLQAFIKQKQKQFLNSCLKVFDSHLISLVQFIRARYPSEFQGEKLPIFPETSENFNHSFFGQHQANDNRVSHERKSLYNWWLGGSINNDERQKLLEISDIDNLELSADGLQKLTHCRKLIESNHSKIGIRERVRKVIIFSTWFSSNCALFVSDGYYITLVIYERSHNSIPETFEVIKLPEIYSSVAEVKNKLLDLEAKLNGSNPILCKSNRIDLIYENKYLPWNVKFDVYSPSDDLANYPEKYFRPLDIVKRFNGDRLSHSCVYLGSKKICTTGSIGDWSGFYGSYNRIIRYHDFIPFKEKKKIVEDLAKAIVNHSHYGSVYTERHDGSEHGNTCEHFVNRCVYGLNICEHLEIEKVKRNHGTAKRVYAFHNIKGEVEGNNKFFVGSASDSQIADKIREIEGYMRNEENQYSSRAGEQKLETYIEITPKSDYKIN